MFSGDGNIFRFKIGASEEDEVRMGGNRVALKNYLLLALLFLNHYILRLTGKATVLPAAAPALSALATLAHLTTNPPG